MTAEPSPTAPREPRRLTPFEGVLTAVLAIAAAIVVVQAWPGGATGVVAGAMAAILVVLGVIDLATGELPALLALPATAFVLVARIASEPHRTVEFLLAAVVLGAAFGIARLISPVLAGTDDVMFAALLGVGLGWGAVGAVAAAFVASLPFALIAMLRAGSSAVRATVPFCPFMAIGGFAILLLPHALGLGGA